MKTLHISIWSVKRYYSSNPLGMDLISRFMKDLTDSGGVIQNRGTPLNKPLIVTFDDGMDALAFKLRFIPL